MRVLCLDYNYGYEPAAYSTFNGEQSCFDFDVVIWDPAHSLHGYERAYPPIYQGLPSLDESSSVRSRADIDRRRAEFLEFVDSGGVLFVITRAPRRFFYDTGERSYSGTGRNQKTTVHVANDDIWRALPLTVSFAKAGGTLMRFVGPPEFSALWRQFKDIFSYEAVIDTKIGTPILKVAGTEKIAAQIIPTKGGGAVVLLPVPSFSEVDDDEDADADADESDDPEPDVEGSESQRADDEPSSRAHEFQHALCDLAARVKARGNVEPLPAWASNFRLPGESDSRSQIANKESQIELARSELTDLQTELNRMESRKHLVTGTGRPLETEVRHVLEVLGGVVEEPEPGRDDWKVVFPEGRAVVEVKGLEKSAGEKDSAQLEKWVANELEETGVAPKGLLIVNGWRTVPIDQRSELVFPDQMLKYSTARGHCLVTGSQMLGILNNVQMNGAERAAYWREKMMNTDGVLVGADDWHQSLADPPELEESAGDNHA
jgi:hypothetical protein